MHILYGLFIEHSKRYLNKKKFLSSDDLYVWRLLF